MKDNQTTGADFGTEEFVSTEPDTNKKETKPAYDEGGDMHGLRFVPGLIQSLESHFSFSVLLVSIIGYIIISAFGQMNSLGKFFGYLSFLIVLLFFYKSLELKDVIKKINRIFLIGFILLLIIVILYFSIHLYKSYLTNGLLDTINFLNKF